MATLRRAQPGEPLRIRASDWNAAMDATRAYLQGQLSAAAGGSPAAVPPSGLVFVKNASGADQDRFAVLGIDAPIVLPTDHEDEFKRQVALSCVLPAEADHSGAGGGGRFVILHEPLTSGGIGRAYVSGVCPVRLLVEDEAHTAADVLDGDATKLTTAPSGGAQVLWKEAGTGDRWAIVRIGGAAAGSTSFFARIGSATLYGDNKWAYGFTQVHYQKQGGFADDPSGVAGTAYNTIESNNAASGTLGNGITLPLPAGVSLQPVGPGAVVIMHTVVNCDDGSPEYVFQFENQVQGECD